MRAANRFLRIALIASLATGYPIGAIAALLGVTWEGEVWRIDESTGALERIGATGNPNQNALAVDPSGIVFSATHVASAGAFL